MASLRALDPVPEAAQELARLLEEEEIDYLLEEIPTALDQTRQGIGRVVEIARAIKEFSHVSETEKSEGDLNRAIETTRVRTNAPRNRTRFRGPRW